MLLVAGSSGVGKSSFVRAGIGAHYIAHGREVVIMTPGEHPIDALRHVDLTAGESLLIVDQCEQAFAADDPAEIREFFDALSQVVFRGMLVVAIRADRLGDLADHEGFAQIIQSHLLMLTALGPDGLRTVIERPAEQAGLILEPGLVEILVRDANGRTLPLLSHALRQVWSRREGRVLTVDGYRASGEIDGAVAKTAEEVYATLSEEGVRLLRDILLRLVESSPDGAVISRRVERTRIAIDAAHAQIVDRLADARLLTTDEESVQLSHEALAREWPRLKEWLADDVEGQRIMRHLGSAAAAWDAMGRPDSELYRGGRLTAAQQWRDAVGPALTGVEREFLDASSATETAGLAAAQNQLRKERRMVRRLSWVSAGAAGLAIVAVTAGILAGLQANLAATAAEARHIAARALDEPHLDRALLLAVEATRLWDSSETRLNLVRVISRAPRLTSIIHIPEDEVAALSMSLSEDGTRASVIDRRPGCERCAPVRSRRPHAARRVLAVRRERCDLGDRPRDWGGRVQPDIRPFPLRRTGTLDLADAGRSGVTTYEGVDRTAEDVEFSVDGSLFAALAPTGQPGGVALWWGAKGNLTGPIFLDLDVIFPDPFSEQVFIFSAVKFSPDGLRMYVSGSRTTIVLETASGEELHRIAGNGILAISPDGSRIAVRDGARAVRIVDPTGVAAPTTVSLSSFPWAADFDPDSPQLAIAGAGVMVASTTTGKITETLVGPDGRVTAAEFRPTGELVTAGIDGAIITWNLGDWTADLPGSLVLRHQMWLEPNERTVMLKEFDGGWQHVVAEPAVWQEHACRIAGRVLTEEEWGELLGARPYAPACRE